ncbi:ABC1 kinase family protein [Gordonia effusa]|uniref:ABC1 kinase family protein n=1 Tax=Gordonia effusa TaxID=263908 RepID=UPI0002FA276C|nr:AarF/ABC1/UbiB kinase family protein [Gordonia effusa]
MGRVVLGRSREEVARDIEMRTAQHFFDVLGELKGGALKLAQILAAVYPALFDDLGSDYRDALDRLLASAPPMLPGAVHGVLAGDLGVDWRDNFRSFDDRRAAAASIGQVHHAIWHDGREVAVKVQYPGIRGVIEDDLTAIRRLSALMYAVFPNTDPAAIIDELSACVREELDYAREAENQRAFAHAYRDDPDFLVPQVVAQYENTLITEWLDGTPLNHTIRHSTQIERDRVGVQLVRFSFSGPQRCGLLYADPHPANFLVTSDGRLGVIDFGACARLSDESMAMLHDLSLFIDGTDPAALESRLREYRIILSDTDIDEIADKLKTVFEPLASDSFTYTNDWLRGQAKVFASPQLDNVVRQLALPPELAVGLRVAMACAGLICQLNAHGHFRDEIDHLLPGFNAAFSARTAVEPDRGQVS